MQEKTSPAAAIMGSGLFLLAAPGVVAGLVPWWISGWTFQTPFLGIEVTRAIGWLPLVFGAALLAETFSRFALQGRGTPAPLYPTQRLVVTGSYRFVRNPMYLAVVSIILGQAIAFASLSLFIYGAAIWGLVHAFVLIYEEPTLQTTYGAEYAAYRAHVRRWLPRLTAWKG